MIPAPHHRLLLEAALAADPDRARSAQLRWSAAADLDTLDHGSLQLLPLLVSRAGDLPDETLAKQVRHVARFTWVRTELLTSRVAPVVAALSAAGLDPMLSKGAALVSAHGMPQRLRPMFDVDLAVPAGRLAVAGEVLHAAGLRSDLDAAIELDPERLGRDLHAAGFEDGQGTSIDLHWHLLHVARNPELDQAFRSRAVECRFGGVACRATGLEDSLVVAVAHGSRWARAAAVRWAADVALLLRDAHERIDWDQVVASAGEARIGLAVSDALEYAGDLVGVTPPAQVRRALRRQPVPVAIRLRRRVPDDPRDGGPVPAGRLGRLAEAYEEDAASRGPLGRRTGPADVARFLARYWGLAGVAGVPGHARWAASGRRHVLGRVRRPRLSRHARGWVAGRGHYELGAEVDLRAPSDGQRWLGPGWWYTEWHGTWSRRHAAHVVLPLRHPVPDDLRLDAYVHAPIAPLNRHVEMRVLVGGVEVGTWQMDARDRGGLRQADVPSRLLTPEAVAVITFVIDPTMTPADSRLNSDLRQIGIAVASLRLAEATAPPLGPPPEASPGGV